jgi:hypothetical protein
MYLFVQLHVSVPYYDLVLRHGTFADDLSANSAFFCLVLNSEVPGLFHKRIKIMT